MTYDNVRHHACQLYFTVVRTYKTSSHCPITPRQLPNPQLLRQREHDVQQGDKPHRLHGKPAYLTIDVEARLSRCLALRVPVENPLRRGDLIASYQQMKRESAAQCLQAGRIARSNRSAPSFRARVAANSVQSPFRKFNWYCLATVENLHTRNCA